jgi:hypothetical protein
MRFFVCVCLCVCGCMHACMDWCERYLIYTCIEREKERERGIKRERERDRQREYCVVSQHIPRASIQSSFLPARVEGLGSRVKGVPRASIQSSFSPGVSHMTNAPLL